MKFWRVIIDKDGNFYGDVEEVSQRCIHKIDENNSNIMAHAMNSRKNLFLFIFLGTLCMFMF